MTIRKEGETIPPYGGRLVDLTTSPERRDELLARSASLPSVQISERNLCDLELLSTGALSPLDRFMGRADYERVVEEMRLSSGTLFPIPVTLPIDAFDGLTLDGQISLRDSRNNVVALMTVDEIYEWDRDGVEAMVFGSRDPRHPLVSEMQRWGTLNISGPLTVVEIPERHDFQELRLTPAETRQRLSSYRKSNVVAFQTRNPLHRAHEELTKRAAREVDGVLLLHPVVGMTKPGDVDHYTRVRAYKLLAENHYAPDEILLALLPLAMRMAGPREAVWHALIRRNYGATHFIVGRDHASPGVDSSGKPFYGPYDAQELLEQHRQEIGMGVIPFQEMVYLPDEDRYEERTRVTPGANIAAISGTEVRDSYLNAGKLLPEWFTRPEVAAVLAEAYPPRHRQGFCVWFTGLSGAGKSTTADVLTSLLLERGRQVTVLDGDVVRTNLSRGLGFSKEDRDANILRIGFVAAEVVRHGGVAICAAVSPYRGARESVRKMIPAGQFFEVFVNTPLEVCEARDTKGLYAKARRGEVKGFTGIDDPYEDPVAAEIMLDTTAHSQAENGRSIVETLVAAGLLRNER
ncbi:MAG: bifunctional sulfate adenylyltransferase/adenylylsulfate kinase [Acidobacteriota bacterium]